MERETQQEEVDRLFALLRQRSAGPVELPKGHSTATAELILETLRGASEALSAGDVSERVGISRPTAQRYLASLAEAGTVRRNLRYGATGRPEHRYELAAQRAG